MALNQAGKPGRAVPDISADADPKSGMLLGLVTTKPNGKPRPYETFLQAGTSLATPLVAGMVADAEQGQPRNFGFLNPLLYSLAGSQAFHDILPVSPASRGYSPQTVQRGLWCLAAAARGRRRPRRDRRPARDPPAGTRRRPRAGSADELRGDVTSDRFDDLANAIDVALPSALDLEHAARPQRPSKSHRKAIMIAYPMKRRRRDDHIDRLVQLKVQDVLGP
jgi:hypothetical protein